MAHNRSYKPEDIRFPDQVITESNLVDEMEKSYIEYAMSVIVGRALPDVRDGLKPVHRRILYTMYESGLTSDKPFKKSATCVGDVLGKYHPHGDASVYDAMVRLAQDFSMRYMLVDGHGNFGSVDGDPPAAYRYTEARLSKISNEMLRDIDKDTVDWDPNFDETRKEPRVLPSRFPNLLVNGSSGIAVGMATNIPPHNLTEVINACVCVLDDPEATLTDLMEHISGPDFPTGGIIMGRSGIRAAYATGRGKIVVRARTEFEEFGKDRVRIVVTELPYQVNKRQLIKNIADQVKDKRLEGISDLRDETDRNGMRMVIELKKDANPQVVLNNLFKQTALQSSFGIIMLALVDNQMQPKILSLRQIIDEYLKHQEEILTRRTQYDLRKARERAHLLEGLLIAQDNIDEVIRIIRSAYDDAKQRLMDRFGLDDIQAQAILDMRLKALQGLDREKLQSEYDELQEKIRYYMELLEDPAKLRAVLREELIEIRDKFGDKRKTEIQDIEDEIDIEDLIEEETCAFT
ncbi:MAG: DNA topoisomerase (ATP-hydrolyzing) subunit A, partial [Faecousia sp.]